MITNGADLLAQYTNMMWSDIMECILGDYIQENINKKDAENTYFL